MQVALQRHDDILRQRIEAAHGYVSKTVGDTFCAVFGRPEQAAAANNPPCARKGGIAPAIAFIS